MKHLLILALLIAAIPANAATSASQNPLSVARPAPLAAAELMITDLQNAGAQKMDELPSECRGYYLRPHKQAGQSRCD